MINIVLLGLSNEIPEHDEKYELHRLLGTLLSKKLTPDEKLKIIENEYDIPMEDDFREELGSMCNLSQGIVEDTKSAIIVNMHKKDYSIEQIAEIVELSEDEVERIIEENSPAYV
jgi:predicted transposase YdaD